jgi:hypothetical protein
VHPCFTLCATLLLQYYYHLKQIMEKRPFFQVISLNSKPLKPKRNDNQMVNLQTLKTMQKVSTTLKCQSNQFPNGAPC